MSAATDETDEIEVLRRASARAAEATRLHVDSRADARAVAISAIRAVEAEVLNALDGAQLRGMADLMRGAVAAPWRGAHLRKKDLDEALPFDGAPCLAVSEHGQLVFVARDVENFDGVAMRPRVVAALDAELAAEDLVAVVRNLARALARHADRVGASAARYAEVLELAARLSRALDR